MFQGALAAFARSGRPVGPGLPLWPDNVTPYVIQYFDKVIRASA
ncbi:hypothetical protein [Rhizobium sp. NPDC090279]